MVLRSSSFEIVPWLIAATMLVCALVERVSADPTPKELLQQRSFDQKQILLAAGKRAYGENRFHEAARILTRAVEIDPPDSEVLLARGMAFEMTAQNARASEDYRKALALSPDNVQAMENLAGIYEQSGHDLDKALGLYRKALKLHPRPDQAVHLAFCIAVLERRLEPEDSSAVGCWNLGNKKSSEGHAEEAFALYSKAIELDPDMFQACFSRGLIRLNKEDFLGAVEDFSEAIRISPTLRGALISRGLAHRTLGLRKKARSDFEMAARIDPRDANAHYHFGRILEEEQEYSAALASYVECLKWRPKLELRSIVEQRISSVLEASRLVSEHKSRPSSQKRNLW